VLLLLLALLQLLLYLQQQHSCWDSCPEQEQHQQQGQQCHDGSQDFINPRM